MAKAAQSPVAKVATMRVIYSQALRNMMATDLQTTEVHSTFVELLADLRRLSNEMLLAFRLQTGHLLLERFYNGVSQDS